MLTTRNPKYCFHANFTEALEEILSYKHLFFTSDFAHVSDFGAVLNICDL